VGWRRLRLRKVDYAKGRVARQKSTGATAFNTGVRPFVQHYLIATTRALRGRINQSLSQDFNSIVATYLLDSASSE